MTLYAGETAQVRHGALAYDAKTRLTSDDVDVTITIWDIDNTTELVSEEPMVYDADLDIELEGEAVAGTGGWTYLFETPDEPGAYRARVTVTGLGIEAFEFKTIRTRTPKAPSGP
jgi:hypothetical protein